MINIAPFHIALKELETRAFLPLRICSSWKVSCRTSPYSPTSQNGLKPKAKKFVSLRKGADRREARIERGLLRLGRWGWWRGRGEKRKIDCLCQPSIGQRTKKLVGTIQVVRHVAFFSGQTLFLPTEGGGGEKGGEVNTMFFAKFQNFCLYIILGKEV